MKEALEGRDVDPRVRYERRTRRRHD